MPQLIFADYPPQIFWLVVTFAILYILMAYVALPRVESVLEERRKRIADDLEAAERSKKDSEAVIAQYEAALAQARSRAQAISADTRTRVNTESASQRSATEAKLAGDVRAAEGRIAAARDEALAKIDGVATEAATGIVERLLGQVPAPGAVAAAVANAARK
ncbi:MAG: F0F1 ATP synthase subunit B' [Alphaproteobacteria bacterium]|jgi:F-type H+-transporting ATPase subunit b|nr:F0F1 ATP synthase subunit B' [Alphaproteobacteria bacterium]